VDVVVQDGVVAEAEVAGAPDTGIPSHERRPQRRRPPRPLGKGSNDSFGVLRLPLAPFLALALVIAFAITPSIAEDALMAVSIRRVTARISAQCRHAIPRR
jgi:hypothetical protein